MTFLEQLDDPRLIRAIEIALLAGDLLSARPTDLGIDTKSTRTDTVTVMDKAAEELIVQALIESFPADGIMGEEGADRPSSSGFQWVVDPLDGTVNYTYNSPLWCVSLALVHETSREGVLGVVHLPALGQTFFASAERGAFTVVENEIKKLHVNDVADLGMTLLGTGFGYSESRRRGQARVIAEFIPLVRDIRRGGSCAIDLCWVASGVLDAYFERGVNPWDHAAGGLIAREAGARVSGLRGHLESSEFILASAPGIYDSLLTTCESLEADTDRPQ